MDPSPDLVPAPAPEGPPDGALGWEVADRLARYDAHKAFLADLALARHRIAMSGPLTTDDGTMRIGSLFVVEALDRATVERFNRRRG